MATDVCSPDTDTPTMPHSVGEGAADPCLEVLRRLWPADAPAPGRLGRFEVLRELGRGGCGVVFLAFDPALGCKVALKVPRLEALLSDDARRRFLNEARAAAALDHPNIVPIREAGEAGPLWYIASAYCEGPTLAAWLVERGGPVPANEAAALVATLADAVEYMHGRGILHRDLKPGNVLLAPAACGFTPRITDFGLAKVRDGGGDTTSTGAGFGTPAYMAPEQVAGAKEVGPAADVYSLGAILYELLAGRPPLEGVTPADTLRLLVGEEPPRLRCGWRGPPRDLEAICLKCLQKEPAKRYATAKGLADDLRRFLGGKPTAARPLTAAGQARKWARRRPALAGLIGVAAAAVVASLLGGLLHYTRLREAKTQLEGVNSQLETANAQTKAALAAEQRESERNRIQLYGRDIQRAAEEWRKGHFAEAAAVLEKHRPRDGQADLRGFEWYHLWRLSHPDMVAQPLGTLINSLPMSPDGGLVATGEGNGTVALWSTRTHENQRVVWDRTGCVILALAFSPDGKTLAAATFTTKEGVHHPEILLWDVKSLPQSPRRLTSPAAVGGYALLFSPDGKWLAVGGQGGGREGGVVCLWDMTDLAKEPIIHTDHFRPVGALAISPNSERLVTGSAVTNLGVLALKPGATLSLEARDDQVEIYCLAFSPDGSRLASGSRSREVRLRDGGTLKTRRILVGHTSPVWTAAFSHGGDTLATGSGDEFDLMRPGEVILWDAATGAERTVPLAHPGHVRSLCLTPDGHTLVTACADHYLRFWNLVPLAKAPELLPGHGDKEAWCVAYSPDSKTLASSGDDGAIRLWDAQTGKAGAVLRANEELVFGIAYSPEGKRLAGGGYDNLVRVWDPAAEKVVATCSGHTDRIRCVAFSPDGKTVASAAGDRTVRLWDAETGEELAVLRGHTGKVDVVAFSAGGKVIASAGTDGTVRLWDTTTRTELDTLKHGTQVHALALAPDGKTLATGDENGIVRIWDLATRQATEARQKHDGIIRAVAFSPDGRTVASGGIDRVVRVWQAATGEELLTFPNQSHSINSLAFAPDGSALAAAVHDGTLRLWRAPRTNE